MTIRTAGHEQLAKDLRRIADAIDAGLVPAGSIMWDPTGIGRISYTLAGGVDDIELDGVEVDDEEDPTPSTAPGKGQP